MNEQEALKTFWAICDEFEGDWDERHYYADKLLCTLLKKDYPNLVEEFKAMNKWYA